MLTRYFRTINLNHRGVFALSSPSYAEIRLIEEFRHMKHLGCYAFQCLAAAFFVPALWAQVNVLTWHNDTARTGQNAQETLLSPSNVNSTSFGLLFPPLITDGEVDAQPLYVTSLSINTVTHNVLYVATENDTVYAFDADTGASIWSQTVLGSGETASDDRGCSQVTPKIGITSTPAIDLKSGPNGAIYVVAMTKDTIGNYHQRLHALDLVTHAELFGGPVEIQATYPKTSGTTTFDPAQYKERAALLISNGIVYTSWASHCDNDPYSAWIIAYNESTLAQTSVLNLTPNGDKGAIWQAGAGPAADAGGNVYFLMANGTFDTTLNAGSFPTSGDYGNAFMNLSTSAGLAVADYFTMDNTVAESGVDTDLGSGGAMLLPTLEDAMSNPRALAVGAGKDGSVYVVDRNNMGKFHGSSNAVYQQFASGGAVYASPAWFNNTLYYGAVNTQLHAFPYSGGSFGSAIQSSISSGFGFRGTTPSISANGTSNGIVWAVNTPSSGAPAVLYALNANNLSELYDSTQAGSRDSFGNGITFTTPTVVNGKVYVGTTTGVGVFGLRSCVYTLAPSLTSPNAGTVTVTTTSGCSWSVADDSTFITVTGGASGTGSGTVSFTLPSNTGINRFGSLIIAGQTITILQPGTTSTNGLAFYPLTPCRIADTRAGFGFEGAFGAPSLIGGNTRSFPVPASFCNVPPNQPAYSLNITALPQGPLGFITVWPTGLTMPVVSTLNAPNGVVTANAAILPTGTNAAINLFASSSTGALIDTNGYFAPPNAPQGLAFYPVTPCRVADTRAGFGFSGVFGPPALTGGVTRNFPVQQSPCGIPSSAQVYSVRMTAIPSGALSYLTTWPEGQTLPIVSTLNAPNGGVVGNQALVPAGTQSEGPISVFASNDTNLLIDINGYFAPPGSPNALYYYPLTPCRVADTRAGFGFSGEFGPPSLTSGGTRVFPMLSSSCGIPSTAQAYSLNITAVVPSGGALGFLTVYPTGQAQPNASTLNAPQGGVVGSAAIVPAGTSGSLSVFSSGATNVLIDINGYFAP